MKLYTKTGDIGTTSVDGRTRVYKSTLDYVGAIDHLSSFIGVVVTTVRDSETTHELENIQYCLYKIGAEFSSQRSTITEEDISELEEAIDRAQDASPPLKSFILPGGSPLGANLHLCRTLAREAERRCVGRVGINTLKYLNRLSDYFFAQARFVNFMEGEPEIQVSL